MRTISLRLPALILCLLILSVEDIWGSSGGEGRISGETFWQMFSFVLLIILLSRLLKKPFQTLLTRRREEVKSTLEQAARQEEGARSDFDSWEKKLGSLSQEIAELHGKISQEGEEERKRIVERALAEGERMKKQAQVTAEQEVKKARASLKREMVDLSVEFAEKLLKEVMNPKDQERLVRDYIGKVRDLR